MAQAVQGDLGVGEENPFRKQEGDCGSISLPSRGQSRDGKCGAAGVRIFYCHACGGKFCWKCLKEHKD